MKYQTVSLFAAKGAIYYVTIAAMIFSRVKITCYFLVWRYHVFARKLTWYFIGVYIINVVLGSLAKVKQKLSFFKHFVPLYFGGGVYFRLHNM